MVFVACFAYGIGGVFSKKYIRNLIIHIRQYRPVLTNMNNEITNVFL